MLKKKKGINVKQLVERMSEGQQRHALKRIQERDSLSTFLGKDFDEKLCDQVVFHLKAALGEY